MPAPVRIMRSGMVAGAVLNALAATLLVLAGIAAVVAAGSSSSISNELGVGLIVPIVLFAGVDGLAAAVGFWAYRALEHERREARTALTGMLGVNTLVALIAAVTGNPGLAVATLLHVAIGAGWLSLLWLPESSRRFFGDPPLATGSPHTSLGAPTMAAGPSTGPAAPPHAHQPRHFGAAGTGAQPVSGAQRGASPGGFPTAPRHLPGQPTERSGEPVTVSLRAHR